ncbi:TPA: hypothetical protein H1016_04690 [archaeon]|uniref:Uncharacterized protein n=1 Tax=Candidatus Naiadarchaeum limnaeum TaxID=2756139 RepID=A0A832V4K5_9ARCH|nr:hypothetical protein [Candidatus Naiadarchaeum limnaeum]
MKAIRNPRGSVEFGINFILKIVLFLTITGSAIFIFNNVALADIKAQTAARNLGVTFDVLALTTKDVTIDANCPGDVIFTIEGSRISAKVSAIIGEGFATYHYLHEKDATLPGRQVIDCTAGGAIVVSKTIDKTTLRSIISIA